MPTFENLESLASVRAKINDGIQNAETALDRLDSIEPTVADHGVRITALESAGPGGSVTIQDEGSTLSTALDTINFVGAGVTVTGGATATVTIPGAAGSNTNLAWDASTSTVTSDTGTDATLTVVDGTNPGLMSVADKTKLNAITGTNTGDQSSIVGITGTKAQFDAAVTDGNIMYVGDAPTAHTHTLANVSDVTMTVANLNSLDDGVNSTLHFHNTDRDRANHTGTQLSTTISDFNEAAQDAVGGMVDTSLVYNDVTPALQRAALTGAITASAGSNTTSLGTFTKVQLNAAISDGDAMYVGDAPTAHTHTLANITDVTMTVANLNSLDDGVNSTLHFHNTDRDRANHTGTQTASTISDFSEAVDDRVATLVVAGTNMTVTYNDVANTLTLDAAGGGSTNLGYTASTRVLTSDTGTDVTLPLVTSTDAGLAPASGGGTTNFLRADGTWAAPSGGGGGSGDVVGPASATDNALARFDATTGKLIQNGGVTLDDDNTMTIPTVTAEPAAPPSGSMAFFATSRASQPWPAFKSPSSAEPHPLQPLIANGNYALFMPAVGTTVTNIGMSPATAGTATGLNVGNGSRLLRMKRLAYRVTTASTTAVASWRNNASQLTIGGGNAWEGGFWGVMHGGPDTGCTNASHRFFMGLGDTGAPTDVNPSTLLRIVGIGYDAADTQVQFIRNDGTGAATKTALGANFPKPNADSTFAYRLRLYSPPGTTQSLSYEVENLVNGAIASGTVTTDLPTTTDFITPKLYTSVGGVSSVVGVTIGPIMFQTED